MVRVQGLVERAPGDGAGILLRLVQRHLHAGPLQLDLVRREVGPSEHGKEGVHGAGAPRHGLGQGAQAGHGAVEFDGDPEVRARRLERPGDGVGVHSVRAQREQGVGDRRQTGQVPVPAVAGIEQDPDVEHRQLRGLDEVHRGAGVGFPVRDPRGRLR